MRRCLSRAIRKYVAYCANTLCLKTIFCSKFIYDQSRNRTFKICISLFMILKWVLSLQFAKNLDFDPKPETNHWITTQAQKFKYLGTKIQHRLFFVQHSFMTNLEIEILKVFINLCFQVSRFWIKRSGINHLFSTQTRKFKYLGTKIQNGLFFWVFHQF